MCHADKIAASEQQTAHVFKTVIPGLLSLSRRQVTSH